MPSTTILPALSVTLTDQDLASHLQRLPGGERLLDHLDELVTQSHHLWNPAALIRTLEVKEIAKSRVLLRCPESGHQTWLTLGCASTFLSPAESAVAGAYTIGEGVQSAIFKASQERDYLHAYLLEQAGLTMLGKTGRAVNGLIENLAATRGWGVGPLLSPGSVHGWELSDQPNLCRLLPLEEVGMSCTLKGVLSPFNSLTFLIGLGPGYATSRIASPCQVCNKRQTCHMSHTP